MSGLSTTETEGRRALVGLSGGVDSSVAAMLLKKRGFEVIGVRMRIYDGPDRRELAYGCYGKTSLEDEKSAENLAKRLGIDFSVVECADPWRKNVLDYFRSEYLAGKTPNPCIRCNETVKFDLLPRLAREKGIDFDFFATGHYARIEKDPDNAWITLRRAHDQRKDQSYFLYRLSREKLERTLFPLGDLTKETVRLLAREAGLAAHNRPDSQDFYGGDYADLLDEPDREGLIVDSSGKILGRHRGFWRYTPGQRKGLGVCGPEPLYVLSVNAHRNEVLVGPAAENSFSGCQIADTIFFLPRPPAGSRLMAKTRSAQSLREVEVGESLQNGRIRINFLKPMSGLAPGQSLVLYRDDLIVGGGIIQGE